MLRREDILRVLKGYGFPEGEYWLMTGASLVLYGVREETRDIDMGVSRALFDRLLARGHAPVTDADGDAKLVLDEFTEVFPEWRPEAVETVCGVPCATLESTVAVKATLGREKDARDIALIREFQARNARA